MKKKLFAFLVVLSTILSMTPQFSADAEESTENYVQNIAFLQAIGSFEGVDYAGNRILTRAEFAELIIKMLGFDGILEQKQQQSSVIDTSFLRENGWLWIADQEEGELALKSSTPFADVTTDSPEWNGIQFVTALNFMKADGEYFRPYENVTGAEIYRAMAVILNLVISQDEVSDQAYISAALAEGLSKGVSERSQDRPFRMEDIAAVMSNTLMAEPYMMDFEDDRIHFKQVKDYRLMTYLFDIYCDKGIVTANQYVALNGYEEAAKGCITIDGVQFEIKGDTDAIIGAELEYYYVEEPDNAIVYYRNKTAETDTKVLTPEDIISFENHILTYYDDNRQKTLNIKSDTLVIYNGVRLDSYTDQELKIKSGNIELMRTKGSSSYNIIKITKYSTMVVSSVDYTAEIVYGDVGDLNLFAVSAYDDLYFCMPDGTEVVFNTIGVDNVISVASTLEGKQKSRCKVIISTDTVSGILTGSDVNEHTLKVDNQEYYYIDGLFDPSKFLISNGIILYVNFEGRVVKAKGNSESGAQYAYLRDVLRDDAEEDICIIRLFETNAEFKRYFIRNRIKLNGKNVKPEKLFETFLDSGGSTINQVIQYWKDVDGNIKEICTADGMDGAFSRYDIGALGVTEVTHRNGALLSFANNGFAAYLNTTGGFICFAIPLDKNDDELYGCINSFGHEQKYTFDELYLRSSESKFVDVCVQNGVTATKSFNANTAKPYMMVSRIDTYLDEDDQLYYEISGYDLYNNVSYVCKDDEWFAACEGLHKGDVIRVMINSMNNQVEYIEKFFDANERTMTNGKTVNGDILHPYEAMHCYAVDTTDSYQFLVAHRFEYTDGKPDYALTKAKYTKNGTRVFKYPARIVVYDSRSNTVNVGSKQDIVYSSNPNNGTIMVVCSYYENAQAVFVIR